MRKTTSLDALLPKTRQGILAAILMRPERAWYVSELARRMGVPSSSLQRELQDLTDAGILKTHRQGRMVYYQANTGSPLFSDLRGLLLKTAGLADVLAEALKPLAARLRVAFVYGSVATGNEQSDSDVDLMVVGSVSPAELSVSLRQARDVLGREINPTLYRLGEYDKKVKAKDHCLVSVLHTAKLFVIGDADALGQSAE